MLNLRCQINNLHSSSILNLFFYPQISLGPSTPFINFQGLKKYLHCLLRDEVHIKFVMLISKQLQVGTISKSPSVLTQLKVIFFLVEWASTFTFDSTPRIMQRFFQLYFFTFCYTRMLHNVQHQGQIQDLNLGGDMYQVAGV